MFITSFFTLGAQNSQDCQPKRYLIQFVRQIKIKLKYILEHLASLEDTKA